MIFIKNNFDFMKGLYYYKLQSPYENDVTKNCKLTINEIDHNFLTLKDSDIKSAEFVRETKQLVLTRNDGDTLVVDLSDVTYDMQASLTPTESGSTLTMSFDGKDGPKSLTISNVVTADKLMDMVGKNVLTKVVTDGTLRGNGTVDNPLGLNGVERTGMLAPAITQYDLTDGTTKLPDVARLGTRYITIENVSDYGYLYNIAGVNRIAEDIEAEGNGWRVPTKADWDALLNSIEPCEYRNHNSAKCHVELGKNAGKYLKSECGWEGQPECECTVTKPLTSCTDTIEGNDDELGIVDDDEMDTPTPNPQSPYGVDKYGMCVLPAGAAILDGHDMPQPDGFKDYAIFWTSSHVYNDADQDYYVKHFSWKNSGVMQEAECADAYYSVRLVKDYDGANYFDTEYIDGIPYKTILFPESGQVWLASNYAKKEGFIYGVSTPEVTDVNKGEIPTQRKAIFLNEWNGEYWEKRQLNEGDTIVIENPVITDNAETEKQFCWLKEDGTKECVTVVIPPASQYNTEYRVYTEDGCSQVLVNTDDIVLERVLEIVVPIIEKNHQEAQEGLDELKAALSIEETNRVNADMDLRQRIDNEVVRAQEAEAGLSTKIDEETARATAAEDALQQAVEDEKARAEGVEAELQQAISNETQRATSEEARIEAKFDAAISGITATEDALNDKIDAEINRAKEAEAALQSQIEEETNRAVAREDEIQKALEDEVERAKAREDEIDGQLLDASQTYVLKVAAEAGKNNMELPSKDGNAEHSVKITFDGNFGEI